MVIVPLVGIIENTLLDLAVSTQSEATEETYQASFNKGSQLACAVPALLVLSDSTRVDIY